MKKLLTARLVLNTPLSMRDCRRPASLPDVVKKAMRNVSMWATTCMDKSRLTRMRMRSP